MFFQGASVTLALEDRLYVEVNLEAADSEVHLQVTQCWATPTTHADDKVSVDKYTPTQSVDPANQR